MNQQYIENYTNDNMRAINRMIELNSQIITYMSNLNRNISNMNYINYISNNIQNNQNNQNNLNNQNNQQNNQNNSAGFDEIVNSNEINYYNNLYNIYNNLSTNNISNIIENCLDHSIYNNSNEENEENEDNICPITKEQYKNGEKIGIIKKCSHSFNYDNIHKWLSKDLRCPLCRHNLLENSNYIEFINNEEKLILTREEFLNLMKDYYNIDARFLLENNTTSINI